MSFGCFICGIKTIYKTTRTRFSRIMAKQDGYIFMNPCKKPLEKCNKGMTNKEMEAHKRLPLICSKEACSTPSNKETDKICRLKKA